MSSTPTSPTSPGSPSDYIFRVILSYNPHHEGQIPLTTGDIVTDVKDLGNGWALARNVTRDIAGIFPSKCIRPMSDVSPTPQEHTPEAAATPKNHRAKPGKDNNPKAGISEEAKPRGPPPPTPTRTRSQPKPPPRKVNIEEIAPKSGKGPITSKVITEPRAVKPQFYTPPQGAETHPYTGPEPHDPHVRATISRTNHFNGESISDPDLTPSDVEYNSLPTPKRGKYDPAKKPHMVVKPNQGKPGSKPEARMEPMMDSPSEDVGEGSHLQPNGQPPRGDHYGPIIAATKIRTANPPGKLLINGSYPRAGNVTDAEKVTDHDQCRDDHQGMSTLDIGGTHDRSTSPMTVVAPTSDQRSVTIHPDFTHDEFDQDNITNESLQRSPHIPRHEKYASINKPCYHDYRTMDCPNDGNYATHLRYKPILKNRHQKVADSKGQHIYYRQEEEKNTSCRLVLSILAGILFAAIIEAWMYYLLDYPLYVATGISAVVGLILIVCFAMSRMCRCTAAILLPSLCTTRGRIAFLFLITSFLLRGPVSNVYLNMGEVSRSMSCSAEQSYNQTMLLLKPFDAMMIKLNATIMQLQQSAHDVHSGLLPLEEGLDRVEMDIMNGHIQLMGTRKTCISLVNTAFNACTSGIHGAQDQCMGVMGALGTVYHHARDVLDRINPEHWAPKQTSLLVKKRQVLTDGGGGEPLEVMPNSDRDICEDLDMTTVCHRLNDSDTLCQPSNWAGEAIQEAVNDTQHAMESLEKALQFRVSSEPYNKTRAKASKLVYEVQQKVQQDFADKTKDFELIVNILLKIMPVAVLLLVYVAYKHVKHYLCSDTYDNTYITVHFKALDQKRSEVAGDNLLPLKRYEKKFLIDTTSSDLSPPEDGLYRIGLCVIILHFSISLVCYLFDYILYWILALIEKHAQPNFDSTGRDSLELVVSGEGVIVDLLDIFLKGFHPGQWFGFKANTQECMAKPHKPSIIYLNVICHMYFTLLMMVLLKGYILRLRNRITGYFFPERRKARTVHLYNVILNQRCRLQKLLQQRAKLCYREQQITEQVSFCHQVGAKCAPCRIFLYKSSKCLVCGCVEDEAFRDCETEKCYGTYCAECFEDLGQVCPLCLHGLDYSDEEDYEEVEDDLQPYHRSSKIYL